MKKTLFVRPVTSRRSVVTLRRRSPLACVWIETGNPRQPLACVWIDSAGRIAREITAVETEALPDQRIRSWPVPVSAWKIPRSLRCCRPCSGLRRIYPSRGNKHDLTFFNKL